MDHSISQVIENITRLNGLTLKSSDDKALYKTIGDYILEVLNGNLKIDINEITVTLANVAVNLSGNVPDKKSYRYVYNAAKYTLGVTEVENNLKIKL